MSHHDASWWIDASWWFNMMSHDDSSWGFHDDSSCWIIVIQHNKSWWFIVNHHDASWWCTMTNHHDSSWWFIMMNHNEASWKDSFQGGGPHFAMGAINRCRTSTRVTHGMLYPQNEDCSNQGGLGSKVQVHVCVCFAILQRCIQTHSVCRCQIYYCIHPNTIRYVGVCFF